MFFFFHVHVICIFYDAAEFTLSHVGLSVYFSTSQRLSTPIFRVFALDCFWSQWTKEFTMEGKDDKLAPAESLLILQVLFSSWNETTQAMNS